MNKHKHTEKRRNKKNPQKKSTFYGKAPRLVNYLELNKRFGRGYQIRMQLEGLIDTVFDESPMDLQEAYSNVYYAVEELNKAEGYNYVPQDTICITEEALEANKGFDVMSAKMYKDAQSGKGKLCVPAQAVCTTEIVDGEEEMMLSAAGVVIVGFLTWRDDENLKAKGMVKRYCQYLALHGYGHNATNILTEVEGMDKEEGVNWIRATHGKYVTDDASLIRFVMSN